MDFSELTENMDSQPLPEKPYEDSQSESNHQDQPHALRTITWTLKCVQGKIDQKAYERLKSEIAWSDIGDDGAMAFKCSDAGEISAFSKQIRTIFAENEANNIVETFSFSISLPRQ